MKRLRRLFAKRRATHPGGPSRAPSPAQQLAALSNHARIVAAATDKERARLRAQQMRDAMPGREWRRAL